MGPCSSEVYISMVPNVLPKVLNKLPLKGWLALSCLSLASSIAFLTAIDFKSSPSSYYCSLTDYIGACICNFCNFTFSKVFWIAFLNYSSFTLLYEESKVACKLACEFSVCKIDFCFSCWSFPCFISLWTRSSFFYCCSCFWISAFFNSIYSFSFYSYISLFNSSCLSFSCIKRIYSWIFISFSFFSWAAFKDFSTASLCFSYSAYSFSFWIFAMANAFSTASFFLSS